MKTVQILGTGCAKCQALTHNAEQAIAQTGVAARIEKVTDIMKITEFGVMTTPALAIDGQVKSAGKLLTVDQIKELLS
ncbi:redox-active disulfide protein 2 [Isosphaera pallida ATCC 43644]|jgi:small redox-active disulfide protein 2|uniref:Redox-active disulfide protein 2 n=1 Tax=Isosphaera pallida (strain ATCC 43644 / DSM 9630 / IS1B) TaxID=575540 RepID=E8QZ02_ISOPI|nr:thioredoxin family protein [Isosphaera pallida]ADV63144.1 redox-active disulfide protein 2 [Isosphaera pallida ATCC 43644]